MNAALSQNPDLKSLPSRGAGGEMDYMKKEKENADSLNADFPVVEAIYDETTLDSAYLRKCDVLNAAIQDIGMGKYQWRLFVTVGFGWFADYLFPFASGLILPPTLNEFTFEAPYIKLGQGIGMFVGAAFWGLGSDIWGRRISYNVTLLIIGVFAVAAGGSPDFVTLASLITVWSFAVGGNMPVDSAIFLEFVPATHQFLLTVLAIWWAFGQLFGALIAWAILPRFSCAAPAAGEAKCAKAENMGWRYFLFLIGGLFIVLWAIRFFAFRLYESPKYLMGKGRDAAAVEVVRRVAEVNGRETGVCVGMLEACDAKGAVEARTFGEKDGEHGEEGEEGRAKVKVKTELKVKTDLRSVVRRSVRARFDADRVRCLFASRKVAWSTSLLIFISCLIGLAYPLYNSFLTYYLASRGAQFGDGSVNLTYRNQAIIASVGVPGALAAGWMVERPMLGRRRTLSIFAVLTGIFILASTTARTSRALLGWNCGYAFTSNTMYGVLYTITPELFPTKARGTGCAMTASANRIMGIVAPIIALATDLQTSVPIFISGAIFIVAGLLALLLPFESQGRASL